MRAHMFPGQGSQSPGMAADLLQAYPEIVRRADEILGYSVVEVCCDDPRQELNDTRFTQPILYLVNALHHLQRMDAGEPPPDVVLGHSLGEFNALQAAGCFSLEEGLQLVKVRGQLFAEAEPGGMAAVFDMRQDEILRFFGDHGLGGIDIAGLNAPAQIVIAGSPANLRQAADALAAAGRTVMPLRTSGAFHSRQMRRSADRFAEVLAGQAIRPPQIPVVANLSARAHQPDDIKDGLVGQVVRPVRWYESIQLLLANGVETFVETGHGAVLTNLLRHIRRDTGEADLSPLRGLLRLGAVPSKLIEIGDAPAAPEDEADPAEAVRRWNRRFGMASKVRWRRAPSKVLQARTEAMLLFGHRPAVYLEGYDGYFDLADLSPAQAPGDGTAPC